MSVQDINSSSPIPLDPSVVLDEARAGAKSHRLDEAFRKYQWIFRHSIEYKPRFSAVRLSYVLKEWREIGLIYPIALTALRQELTLSKDEVIRGDSERAVNSFRDFVAISRALGETSESIALFSMLHDNLPELARKVYPYAENILVEAKQFRLCGVYLEPENRYRSFTMYLEWSQSFKNEVPSFEDYESQILRSLQDRIVTLVLLLELNDREAEARHITAQAKVKCDDSLFHERLDHALNGMADERVTGNDLPLRE